MPRDHARSAVFGRVAVVRGRTPKWSDIDRWVTARKEPGCVRAHTAQRLSMRATLSENPLPNDVAPTQPVPVIRQNPKEPIRELSLMRWGLIPSWSKDSSGAARMFNARAETAATKPAFRDAMKSRRCMIRQMRFTSGCGRGKQSSRIVSRSVKESYSHSRDYGIAGKTQAAVG